MAFKCRQCPHREFISRAALIQHRQSPGHPCCTQCGKYCNSQEELEAHTASDHPEFACRKCKQNFLTQASLEDHYRGKAATIHPKCSRCGKGFFDAAANAEHLKAAHPIEDCSCNNPIYVDELQQHYLTSTSHPTCLTCTIGFKDDVALNAHNAEAHPECRCNLCDRQFPSEELVKSHFDVASVHPKCPICKLGFFDDRALKEHVLAAHTPPPPVGYVQVPAYKGTLAIEGPPLKLLPAPGKETNAIWNSTKNEIVATFNGSAVQPSSAFLHGDSLAKITTNELSKPANRGSEPPRSRLFEKAMEQNLVSSSQTSFNPFAETGDKVSDSPKPALWNATHNGVFSDSNSTNKISSASPKSSRSGSTVGFSERSSNASGITGVVVSSTGSSVDESIVSPPVTLRCMVCMGRPIKPTATMCGHIFCNQYVHFPGVLLISIFLGVEP
ncbi:hypothetical protein R3P38DRAFT_3168140 [Favolaschia claudopus]|uniref:C2H2-type domain-containing protein n=1 Tax=Favolaschia claudopus TaxID=2862362 RepID=A0AAW0E702_9AGAR